MVAVEEIKPPAALGAIAGLDAVMINTAELTGKAVDVQLGIIAFIIANAVNLITKTAYSFANGSPDFARKLAFSLAAIIVASCIGLFFV